MGHVKRKFSSGCLLVVPDERKSISLRSVKIKTVRCSYKQYDKLLAIIEQMQVRADDYAPSVEEINTRVLPNLEKYMAFLIWIDDTGYDTDENVEARQYIKEIVKTSLQLYDNEENL